MYCKKCGKDVPYGVVVCEECATGKTPTSDYKAPPTVSQPGQAPSRFDQPTQAPPNSGPIPPQSPYPGGPGPNSPYPGAPAPNSPYGNSPYPGQPYQSQAAAQSTSGMAVASLVVSLVAILFIPIGIVGLILGIVAKNQIRASGGRLGGSGMAIAGIIIGSLELGLCILVLLMFPVFMAAFQKARLQRTYPGTRINKLNTTPTRVDYSSMIHTAANWPDTMKAQA